MREKIRKYRLLFVLSVWALVTVTINQFPYFIEHYYATGLYVFISRTLRFGLGWVPFSVGDILYGAVIVFGLWQICRFVNAVFRKKISRQGFLHTGRKLSQALLIIYISFNWLWGFNYNRLGSAYQMDLSIERYTTPQLVQLTDSISAKLQLLSAGSTAQRIYSDPKQTAIESAKAYSVAAARFPFLKHPGVSVKAEMLYNAGNYLGFLGYFNPFTSEAQLNTTIPKVLFPYVCCHEMAHQLGYASESEANFVGYLACKESKDAAFQYSVYFDLFSYAINDLYHRDSTSALEKIKALPQKVKDDRKEVRIFFNSFRNPFNPIINWIYDKYLKLNSQPKGKESYNEVVGWLIAYTQKYGWGQL